MINACSVGIHPRNTGAQNLAAFVDCIKANPKQGVYFPTGTYLFDKFNNSLFDDIKQTQYIEMRGDGQKLTTIKLDPAAPDDGRGMWDYYGLHCFDQAFEDLTFNASDKDVPFVFRLESGGHHYRVGFNRVMFRGAGGDGNGLQIEHTQAIQLTNCTSMGNGGWGVRLEGPHGLQASMLDTEHNAQGGLFITDYRDGGRAQSSITINGLYCERNPVDVRIEHCRNARITGLNHIGSNNPVVEFGQGAHHNLIADIETGRATFERGSFANRVHGTGVQQLGVNGHLNHVGMEGLPIVDSVAIDRTRPVIASLYDTNGQAVNFTAATAGTYTLYVDFHTPQAGTWACWCKVYGQDIYYNWYTGLMDPNIRNADEKEIYSEWYGEGQIVLPIEITEPGDYTFNLNRRTGGSASLIYSAEVV